MKILEQKIRLVLEELKKEKGIIKTQNKKQNFCIVKLVFNINDFYKQVRTIGEFLKKLRNNLPENRPFFIRICKNGLYNFIINQNEIEINIYMELNEMFDKSELTSKIVKIVKPKKMEISFDEENLYNETFNKNFIVSDWGLFGLEYRNKRID